MPQHIFFELKGQLLPSYIYEEVGQNLHPVTHRPPKSRCLHYRCSNIYNQITASHLQANTAIRLSIKSSLDRQSTLKYLLAQMRSMFLKQVPWWVLLTSEWDKSVRTGLLSGEAKLEDVPQKLIYTPQALFSIESKEPDFEVAQRKTSLKCRQSAQLVLVTKIFFSTHLFLWICATY